MRILTHRWRGWLAASAAAATLAAAGRAQAQYGPYVTPTPYSAQQPYAATQPQYVAGQPATVPLQNAQPQYGQTPYGQTQQAQTPTSYGETPYAPYGAAQPQYAAQGAYQGYASAQPGYGQQPYAAPRVAMTMQGDGAPVPGDNLPLSPPIETVPPGAVQGGGYIPPTPMAEPYPPAGAGYGAAPGCNCQPGYGQAGGYESLSAGQAYGACNVGGYGCGGYSTYGGMGAALKHGGCGYWFGGVYGLLMDRDESNRYALAYVTDPSMPTNYPTATPNVVMTTRSVDVGFQPGVEFRLGRAFGAGYDPFTCASCGPNWGLEGVYWTLFEEDDSAVYVNPTATSRTYTMMPMYGLEYDHGAGYFPVNEYWDHGMPSMPANPIRVTQVRTFSSFEVQNVEVNLLKFSACGGGVGPASYGAAYGVSACGGCATDSCATGGCSTGCVPCGKRYSCTAVCGFRWMQFDEEWMFGVDYFNSAWPTPSGYLNYWATTENNLFGGQIGCNGMYRIGCKWGLHLNTLVGLYGNDIDVRQYMVSPTGAVRYIGTAENFDVQASKTDVAMLGEVRLGASYQATSKWRLYGGWRAIGVTGLALATDQAPNAFLSSAQLANYVNSNGSLILHGLQAGVEWNY